MRRLFVVFLFISGCSVQRLLAQQTPNSAADPMQTSLSAMLGQSDIHEIHLSGSVDVNIGPSTEQDPFHFQANVDGSNRTEIHESSGVRLEERVIGPSGPSATWSKGDTVQHTVAFHNQMAVTEWFSPALLLRRIVKTESNLSIAYIGRENGLDHYRVTRITAGGSARMSKLIAHFSQIDLYIDPTTMLPASIDFFQHPDKNASIDIPVTIKFADYQRSDGVLVPFSIEKYLNGTLLLGLHVHSVSVN